MAAHIRVAWPEIVRGEQQWLGGGVWALRLLPSLGSTVEYPKVGALRVLGLQLRSRSGTVISPPGLYLEVVDFDVD